MSRVIKEREDVIPLLTEVFLARGYEGTTLALIEERTGLGRSSLYHFFRGGKSDMAAAVLADQARWLQTQVETPLREAESVATGLDGMFSEIEKHFAAGRKNSLEALFAMDHTRDLFAVQLKAHFFAWASALTRLFMRAGYGRGRAWAIAEETLASIHGALVLARGMNDPKAFTRSMRRLRQRLQGTDQLLAKRSRRRI